MEGNARQIIEKMYNADLFSQWLGIQIIAVNNDNVIVQLQVRKEMLNGFSILHGGIAYSLADSALAFASNAGGKIGLSIETAISHLVACKEGDVLTATTEPISSSDKIAVYSVRITNQQEKVIAYFRGTVYYTSKTWEL